MFTPTKGIFLIESASKGRKISSINSLFQEKDGENNSQTRAVGWSTLLGKVTLWPLDEGIHLSCKILMAAQSPKHHLEPLTITSLACAMLLQMKEEWVGILASIKEHVGKYFALKIRPIKE